MKEFNDLLILVASLPEKSELKIGKFNTRKDGAVLTIDIKPSVPLHKDKLFEVNQIIEYSILYNSRYKTLDTNINCNKLYYKIQCIDEK